MYINYFVFILCGLLKLKYKVIFNMSSVKYTFYHLSNKEPAGLCSTIVQEHLLKL